MKRLTAALVLLGSLLLGAGCADPRSPVGSYQPTLGTVGGRLTNSYGPGLTWYYLYIISPAGGHWVDVTPYTYFTCERGDLWSRALGCR